MKSGSKVPPSKRDRVGAVSNGSGTPRGTPTSAKARRVEGAADGGGAPALPVSSKDAIPFMTGVTNKDFFRLYFEKKPLYHASGDPKRFHGLGWTTPAMVAAAMDPTKELHYGTDLNVVKFDPSLQRRVPFRTEGPLDGKDLQSCMANGWSARFLRPHEHSDALSAFLTKMELVFGCNCGANSYWTPPGSQGFAPHFDDVDVFLLQVEGQKAWKVYDSHGAGVLTRHSSEDFTQDEMPKPSMELIMKPGDCLYMPRGTSHQGKTVGSEPSLHVTVSSNQMHSYADYLHKLFSNTIETMAANDVTLRATMPRHWLGVLGYINRNGASEEKAALEATLTSLAHQVVAEAVAPTALAVAADKYAAEDMTRRQPPRSSTPAARRITDPDAIADRIEALEGSIKLVAKHAARLSVSGGEAQVFHTGANTIRGPNPIGLLRFEEDFGPAVEAILAAYPTAVALADLPMGAFTDEDALENRKILAEALVGSNAFELV